MIMETASAAARDAAMEQVNTAVNPEWRETALDAIYLTARHRAEFIVDDVWQNIHGNEPVHDKRAIGPLMRVAKREGWITPTDKFRPSYIVHHHATPRRVWKSRILA
jgi:hypothetical protein